MNLQDGYPYTWFALMHMHSELSYTFPSGISWIRVETGELLRDMFTCKINLVKLTNYIKRPLAYTKLV